MSAFASSLPILHRATSSHKSLLEAKPLLPNLHAPPRRPRARTIPLVCESSSSKSRTPNPHDTKGFVLWGPPGSGKSTLCEALSHSHGLVHISTGALLRAHVLYETELGVRARPYVHRTELVPDDIVIPMVLERLSQVDCLERGFILDGFPRNVHQHNALHKSGFRYLSAFLMHAPRETLDRRIRYRRLDPETDLLYNLQLRPAGSQEVLERLVVLDKDRGANVAELFAAYGRSSAEMYDLLMPRAVRIDANRPFDDVLADIAIDLEKCGVARFMSSDQNPRSLAKPRVAIPPDALGRASAVRERDEAETDPAVNRPASAAAAMRATSISNEETDEDNTGDVHKKVPITLIRCDGYICERESVDDRLIAFRGSATEQVMLVWNRPPKTTLLLVKKDPELMPKVLQAAKYLMEEEKLNVIVEPQVQTQALANGVYLDTFASREILQERVDFVICLGGDGLILHASTVFRTAVPPVISFNLGSLGFLTPFQFDDFKTEIKDMMKGNCNLSLRMRLTCSIIRDEQVASEFQVLNEVVVDRGASPYLSNLDCFCDGKYITTVQADGIIMSTPTGSTAYSMSAGGSMVHPSVPAILFTPICPHSLSFRPIVFPDSAKLRIEIAEDARSHAWASFDGKSRQQLRRGDGLLVEMNMYPVPTINKTDHTGDWFQSLDRAFNFNSRAIQKPLTSSMRSRPISPMSSSDNIEMNGKSHREDLDRNNSDITDTDEVVDSRGCDNGVEQQVG